MKAASLPRAWAARLTHGARIGTQATVPSLDLDVLREQLCATHPGLDLRRVEVIERARCGDGLASTADRVSVRLVVGARSYAQLRPELEIEAPRAGVAAVPSIEHAWLRYRQGMIWGLVIGWLITPPQNYGVEITRANISKMVNAMQDLDTLAVIPQSKG
jgi:hypothetical protein